MKFYIINFNLIKLNFLIILVIKQEIYLNQYLKKTLLKFFNNNFYFIEFIKIYLINFLNIR